MDVNTLFIVASWYLPSTRWRQCKLRRMFNYFVCMLLHGPCNRIAVCVRRGTNASCMDGTSGLSRTTGYNNETKNLKIAFCEIS